MKIEVNGQPAPQGSKRHVGGGRMIEMSNRLPAWREAVRAETQRVLDREGSPAVYSPADVEIYFWLPRPKSAPKYVLFPVKRPDLDKLARAVLDGLVAGGALNDDSQVVTLYLTKRFAEDRGPGCVILVEEAAE